MDQLPIFVIFYPGTFLPIFVYFLAPLGILISGVLSVMYTVRLVRFKREGKALKYTRRGLIISLIIFAILVPLFLLMLMGNF